MPFLPPNQQRRSSIQLYQNYFCTPAISCAQFPSFTSVSFTGMTWQVWWTHNLTTIIILQLFLWDYQGEPVPEETFTHLHLSWSSIILYLLPPSTTIHSIHPVQFTCLTIFLHNFCPSFIWSTFWSVTLHFILIQGEKHQNCHVHTYIHTWQWHQLDHMQLICSTLQTDHHASSPSLIFYGSDALPDAQPAVSKHWRHCMICWFITNYIFYLNFKNQNRTWSVILNKLKDIWFHWQWFMLKSDNIYRMGSRYRPSIGCNVWFVE